MRNTDLVGLLDPVTGETRLACVLGNGGEVFGAAMYRGPAGIRWILSAVSSPESCLAPDAIEGMDALKFELVPKRELRKEEVAALAALDFKPSARGGAWSQFQSARPGWLPWCIDQAEAEQLLADLPRLTLFHALLREHPDLFDGRPGTEIPFLPSPLPDRPLTLSDLDWRPLLVAPEEHQPFIPNAAELAKLESLARAPKSAHAFGSFMLPGAPYLERGRPCLSRISLLVETRRGLVLAFEPSPGHVPFSEAAGAALVKTLLKSGALHEKLLIPGGRLEPVLKPFCKSLNLTMKTSDSLPALSAALESLSRFMAGGLV